MRKAIFAIDPGTFKSAWCRFDGEVIKAGIMPNLDLEAWLVEMVENGFDGSVAIEKIVSYGKAVGQETLDTCVWVGRFLHAAGGAQLIRRVDVKKHVCHDANAKDPNIRQALIDRFGNPGTKKAPGLTYGLSADMWAALAVAVTAWDKFSAAPEKSDWIASAPNAPASGI